MNNAVACTTLPATVHTKSVAYCNLSGWGRLILYPCAGAAPVKGDKVRA